MNYCIHQPKKGEITVYSKSGCPNCVSVKNLLKENNIKFTIIDCDEYILENKGAFLQFISNLAGKEYKTFPMVFDDTKFIGGFIETGKYLEKILDFDLIF